MKPVLGEIDEPVEAGLRGGVLRPVLPHPRPVRLLEPERHHRPHPEGLHPVRLPGRGERLMEGDLVRRVHVDLVAEVARVAQAADERGDEAHLHLARVEEAEGPVRDVRRRRRRGEHLARPGTRDLEPDALERDVAHRDAARAAARREVRFEPAHVESLRGVRGGELEPLRGEPRYREVRRRAGPSGSASGSARLGRPPASGSPPGARATPPPPGLPRGTSRSCGSR